MPLARVTSFNAARIAVNAAILDPPGAPMRNFAGGPRTKSIVAARTKFKEWRRVRIGINALGLLPNVIGGGETYLRGLIGGFGRLRGDDEFVLFTNRENHPTFAGLGGNFRRVLCNFSARWNVASLAMTRVIGEQIYLPWRAARERVEVIHSPLDTTLLRSQCPTVMTLHDMNFDALPEATNPLQRSIARALVKLSARRANAIITVSEFSRREIMAKLKLPENRLFVIHNGVGEAAEAQAPADPEAHLPIGVDEPYIVAFSSINPHKNIAALMRAFARLKTADRHLKLIVIGHQPGGGESLPELARRLEIENRMIFTGYVGAAAKQRLLRGARLLAFPSLYEGFGLPVIEAMRAGVPVACSARAALPEIAGSAARMFDPDDLDDFGAALSELLTDEAIRARLIAAGHLNARRFSWDRAARMTLRVYQQAAGGGAASSADFFANDSASEPADLADVRRA